MVHEGLGGRDDGTRAQSTQHRRGCSIAAGAAVCPSIAASLRLYLSPSESGVWPMFLRLNLLSAALIVLTAALLSGASSQERRVPSSPGEVRLSYAPVVQRAAPAVVNVYAAKMVAMRNALFDARMCRR